MFFLLHKEVIEVGVEMVQWKHRGVFHSRLKFHRSSNIIGSKKDEMSSLCLRKTFLRGIWVRSIIFFLIFLIHEGLFFSGLCFFTLG